MQNFEGDETQQKRLISLVVFGARVVSTALESVDESRIVRHSRGYIPEFEIHHKKPRPPKVTSLPLLEKQQQKIKVGPPAPRSIRHVSTATASLDGEFWCHLTPEMSVESNFQEDVCIRALPKS